MSKLKFELVEKQIIYLEKIQHLNYNMVTCPSCGGVFICKIDEDIVNCPHCYELFLQSECSDLFYPGWKQIDE